MRRRRNGMTQRLVEIAFNSCDSLSNQVRSDQWLAFSDQHALTSPYSMQWGKHWIDSAGKARLVIVTRTQGLLPLGESLADSFSTYKLSIRPPNLRSRNNTHNGYSASSA